MTPNYTHRRIFERDRFTCQYCGWSGSVSFDHFYAGSLTVDHVTPVSAGGTDTDDNLVVACHACNLRKGGAVCATFEEAKRLVLKRREAARTWFETFVLPLKGQP